MGPQRVRYDWVAGYGTSRKPWNMILLYIRPSSPTFGDFLVQTGLIQFIELALCCIFWGGNTGSQQLRRKIRDSSHQSLLLLSPAWPCANPLTSVSLCFLIYKMGWYWFRLYRKCSKRWCTVWNSTFSFSSVTQLRPTLCNPMDCSMPGFPFHHQLPELAQIHVHWVSDAIQASHPPSPPSSVLNLSQHQGLFHWVSSLHHTAKVLEL